MDFRAEPISEDAPWEDDEVWVVGVVMKEIWDEPAVIGERGYWDVTTGHDWLTREFIPMVQSGSGLNITFLKPKTGSAAFQSGRQSPCPRPETVESLDQLNFYVNYLQQHSNAPGRLHLKADEVRSLYLAVALCVDGTGSGHNPYVRNTLPFRLGDGEDAGDGLRGQAAQAKEGVCPNIAVDRALRCMAVPLRESRSRFSRSDIMQMADCVSPLYEHVMRKQLLERACPDYPEYVDEWDEDTDDEE